MNSQRFASVWDAIEDTLAEAENMKLRSNLMRGKINLFGLNAQVNMATAAGLHIEMRVLETA
ncbi:MAG: hypothetical protein LBE81_08400 [Azonexus sp.]|jgi:predicted XRE-type DNA-binding protein|uniref:hypothetical protein n=1 Tax=Azonexus sp. TaxID=1872668 RepID=UPI00282ECCA6|nr:hypothetical protein [Azonexus sp.]MDR0776643.1 hypothetical protein [Azonexus sp.]